MESGLPSAKDIKLLEVNALLQPMINDLLSEMPEDVGEFIGKYWAQRYPPAIPVTARSIAGERTTSCPFASKMSSPRSTVSRDPGESDLAMVFNAAQMPLVRTNTKLVITNANEAARLVFGYEIEEMIGSHVNSLCFHERDKLYHEQYVKKYTKNHLDVESVLGVVGREVEGLRKDGSKLKLLLTTHSVTDGFIAIFVDVTESANSYERIMSQKLEIEELKRKAESERKEVAVQVEKRVCGYLCHEVRNGIAAIQGSLDSLEVDSFSVENKNVIDCIATATSFVQDICNSLLDIQKIESGTFVLSADKVDLFEALTTVKNVIAPRCSEGVELHTECSVTRRVLLDKIRFEQVLINIASNAAKFTKKGTISISISLLPGNRLSVVIEDTGVGMDAAETEKLFQRFYQKSTSIGSTGLGLNISKNLVQLMHGAVNVESKVGMGSRFSIIIPVSLIEEEEGVLARPAESVARLGEEGGGIRRVSLSSDEEAETIHRIAIVDDQRMNQQVFSRQMQKLVKMANMSALVRTFSSGEELLEAMRSDKPSYDLVMIDQHMGMHAALGTDVAARLRTELGFKNLIVGMSGNDLKKEFIAHGADGFVSKPMKDGEKHDLLRLLQFRAVSLFKES